MIIEKMKIDDLEEMHQIWPDSNGITLLLAAGDTAVGQPVNNQSGI